MSAFLLIGAFAQAASPAPAEAAPPSPTPPATTEALDAPQRGVINYVDLQGGVGYSINPRVGNGGSSGAGFGNLSVNGVHARSSARSTTILSGLAQTYFYTRGGSQQSFRLTASHNTRATENLSLSGDLGLSYDKGGRLDTSLNGLAGIPFQSGINPPLLLPLGSDFLSIGGRTFRANGNVGAQYALSSRDFLNASTGLEYVKFDGVADSHYIAIPVSLGWDRQISTRTTIGGSVSARFTDYGGPGSFRSIAPALTFQTALSSTVSLRGNIGVSFAESDDGITTSHSTGLTASVTACSRGDRDSFCGRASVDQQAATVAGPARTIDVGVDYSRQLGPDDSIRLSVNATRFSSPVIFTTFPSFSRSFYVRGAADYSRRIGDRLFGGVNVSARKVTRNGPDPRADFSGSLFIRYRLGDLQ